MPGFNSIDPFPQGSFSTQGEAAERLSMLLKPGMGVEKGTEISG
jgi:hypothetical protein